jgi:hypothetical protein
MGRKTMDCVAVEDQPEVEEVGLLHDHYMGVAKSIWPNGTVIHCSKCGRVQTVSVGEAATFLEKGWPTCCRGETMWVGDPPTN